jgi:pimeloyl-ACP methyl ester carboxylesterase
VGGLSPIESLWPGDFPWQDQAAYVEPMVEELVADMGIGPSEVVSSRDWVHRWERDAQYTYQAVADLKADLIAIHNANQDKPLIVISHSWGALLTYAALADLRDGPSPVPVDLFITCSTILGAPYVHPDPNPGETAAQNYLEGWLARLFLPEEIEGAPPISRWVNYWAMADMLSGPLADSEYSLQAASAVLDIQVDEAYAYTPADRTLDNILNWHFFDRLLDDVDKGGRGAGSLIREEIQQAIDAFYE